MHRLLNYLLGSFIQRGNLQVTTARGRTFSVGDGTGKRVAVRFLTCSAELGLVLNPELKVGEAYMNGDLIIEEGTVLDLVSLAVGQNHKDPQWTRVQALARFLWRRLLQFNPRGRARKNVAHHYDLDRGLYSLFLDADLQYSCAYFDKPGLSLEDAQLAKKRHLAAKLQLPQASPGELKPASNHSASQLRVLDIGSGWGGLALYLAEISKACVTGVTLSAEQLGASRARAVEKGLAHKCEFQLQDYRDVEGRFDRIVSVGMFEHVGKPHYREFFQKCFDLLADDGIMLLHTIGRLDGPADTNQWIWRYIFPGGYAPALSEIVPFVERSGFIISDVEVLRIHYAETLRHWRDRFIANRDEATSIYDERFVRMWEFYLSGCEAFFRHGGLAVFQIQLVKDINAVPLTREYMYPEQATAAGGNRSFVLSKPWNVGSEARSAAGPMAAPSLVHFARIGQNQTAYARHADRDAQNVSGLRSKKV
jgi:cyclopropane-fatty-acyl-phospholipid synthase